MNADAVVEVQVHAELCGSDELGDDDRDVPGIYAVRVDAALPAHQMASAALDAFHSTVPVDELERFSLRVTLDGRDLDEDPAHDSYSLSSRARVVEKIEA